MGPQVLLLPNAFAGPLKPQVVARRQVRLDWRGDLETSGGHREQPQHAPT